MTVGSPLFILYVIIALYFWWGLPSLHVGIRLLLLNGIFLTSIYSDWSAVLPIAVFAGVGYIGLVVIAHFLRASVLFLVLATLVGLFVIIKRYSLVVGVFDLPITYLTVGMSYVLFRVLQLAIDLHQEALERRPTVIEYLNFLFFFLTFVSGPHSTRLNGINT
jgi:hypothetical protein